MIPVAGIAQQSANVLENAASAGSELWRFALAYYARPGAAAALLALQDRERLDVNLILFALWHGLSGRGRLDCEGLAAADRAVGALRSDLIEPLRALRRRLEPHPDPDIRSLREAVKAIEIEAEKAALHRLAANAASPVGIVDRSARTADADANLALCLGPDPASSTQAAILRDRLASFVADC